MTVDHDELRRLLGGYLLGGLDDSDTDRIDAHLLSCDDCRAELDRLTAVPELLRSLPRAEPTAVVPGARPSAARIEGLLGRMRLENARERRRSLTRRLAVAAAVLLIAAISGGLVLNRDDAPTPAPQAAPSQSSSIVVASFEAADGSGLTGQAVLTGKTWGVSVDLAVQKLAGEGPFVCEVEGGEGRLEQAAMWGPTPSGNARVTGASSIQLTNVSGVLVKDEEGHVLGTAHLN